MAPLCQEAGFYFETTPGHAHKFRVISGAINIEITDHPVEDSAPNTQYSQLLELWEMEFSTDMTRRNCTGTIDNMYSGLRGAHDARPGLQ